MNNNSLGSAANRRCVCVYTLYTKLARDITYRQRITHVDGIAMHVAEYLGKFLFLKTSETDI